MRLLVIGGSGFIGHHLLAKMVCRKGWNVSSLSLNPPAVTRRVDNVDYLFADIRNSSSLIATLKEHRFEFVVNLGGYPDHSSLTEGGENQIDLHFNAVINLVKALQWQGLRRFVQVGSSDEYGTVCAPQHEEQREQPISPYAVAKLSSTQFLQMLHRTEKFPVVCIRLFLAYGPGQSQTRLIPQIIRGSLDNETFPVSSGKQLRDFCFIDDIVSAIQMILDNDDVTGKLLNIASGIPRSVESLVNLVCQITGRGKPQFGEIPYRPAQNKELFADITKVKEILPWEPQTEIETGLLKTIEWMKRHDLQH